MDIKDICSKLKQNEGVVICAPSYTEKNKLRVYLNGGLIGKIYFGNRNGKSNLMSNKYQENYMNTSMELRYKKLVKNAKSNEDILKILISDEYIKIAEETVNKKFTKKTANSKERLVETKIVDLYMNNNKKINIIDMEVCFPSDYIDDKKIKSIKSRNNIKEEITKQPRFDMISISDDGIGIIELKVDNKNYSNMIGHFVHMVYALENKQDFIDGIINRLNIMSKFGLINKETYDKYKNCNKIWCGFLFVNGKKESSIKIINNKLKGKLDLNKIKFKYCNDDYIKLENMQNYDEFIKLQE